MSQVFVDAQRYGHIPLDYIEDKFWDDDRILAVVTRINNVQIRGELHCFRAVLRDQPEYLARKQDELFNVGVKTVVFEPLKGNVHPVLKRYRVCVYLPGEPTVEILEDIARRLVS